MDGFFGLSSAEAGSSEVAAVAAVAAAMVRAKSRRLTESELSCVMGAGDCYGLWIRWGEYSRSELLARGCSWQRGVDLTGES